MLKIKLTTPFPEWPLERQTPYSSGIWGNCEFFINRDVPECDFWVVYDNLLAPEATCCPAQNTILITGEPPSIRRYACEYIRQFSIVITCHRKLPHPNVVHIQQALPWHIGWKQSGETSIPFSKDYDKLSAIRSFTKDRLISTIVSSKDFTKGHRRRLDFVEHLSNHFGSRLDVFGRGIRDIEDKWDAIARYKYHVVIENSAVPDYWTEKLADAYLGGAFPIYYGCPNLSDYFSPTAYVPINLDISEALLQIEHLIKKHLYEQSIEDILIAREMVLNKYNLFPMLCEFCNSLFVERKSSQVTLLPMQMRRSTIIKRLWRKLSN